MGIEKKTYSFRLDMGFMEKIKYFAEKENRSVSNFVETVLKQHIKNLEELEKIDNQKEVQDE